MVEEYFPKKIEIDWRNQFAIVTMNSIKDVCQFFKRYQEYCQFKYPKFFIQPEMIQGEMYRKAIPGNYGSGFVQSGALLQQFPQFPPINQVGVINPMIDPMIDQLNQLRISKFFIKNQMLRLKK
jgi:hypothetical protein